MHLRNLNINKYFKNNPFINEDNLVEVNQKFKQVPKVLRYCWHEYMLNRDRQPSEYINSVSCIDQPTRSSAYKNISNSALLITIMVTIITVLANFVCVYSGAGATDSNESILESLFTILLFPSVYLFIGLFVVTFLKINESSRYADLYYEFHEFERYLNQSKEDIKALLVGLTSFKKDLNAINEGNIKVLQEPIERAMDELKNQDLGRKSPKTTDFHCIWAYISSQK